MEREKRRGYNTRETNKLGFSIFSENKENKKTENNPANDLLDEILKKLAEIEQAGNSLTMVLPNNKKLQETFESLNNLIEKLTITSVDDFMTLVNKLKPVLVAKKRYFIAERIEILQRLINRAEEATELKSDCINNLLKALINYADEAFISPLIDNFNKQFNQDITAKFSQKKNSLLAPIKYKEKYRSGSFFFILKHRLSRRV